MSTHNICIRREMRKILCGYPLLSVAINGIQRLAYITCLIHDNAPAHKSKIVQEYNEYSNALAYVTRRLI